MNNENKIKFPAIEKNLAQDSRLRKYLAHKEETGVMKDFYRPEAKKIRMRDAFDQWPKILLVMPPITLSEGTVKRVIPPLGLAYIGAYLETQGIPFEILDSVVEGKEQERKIGDRTWEYGLSYDQIGEHIKKHKPDILGLSVMYSSDLHALYAIAKIAKQIDPNITVVAGGIHLTIYPQEVMDEATEDGKCSIDYIIRGEGEIRFSDFVKNFKEGMIDLNADGLVGWHNGELFINDQYANIKDVDSIPLPAYHRLPMEKYLEYNVPFSPYPRGNRVMQIYSSRGCPIGCTFCASTNFNKVYRGRSPDNVIEEIKYYQKKYNIDEIQFGDDNLTFNLKRSLELFEKLKECNIQWCTPNGIFINSLTEELLEKMIDSGLYQITLSLDSGSAKTLKQHHRKPVDLKRLPDLIKFLKQRKVLIHLTLVVGMPGETKEDIEEGFAYAKTLDIDSIAVFIAQALPGSELYEKSVADGIITPFQARIIDTELNLINLSEIPKDYLEQRVTEFVCEFNKIIKQRNPEGFKNKYDRFKDKLKSICIGSSHNNVEGIIQAYEPTPTQTL